MTRRSATSASRPTRRRPRRAARRDAGHPRRAVERRAVRAMPAAHYRFEPMTFRPTPVQRPRIPIWVVGAWPAERSMARAARWDGLVAQATERRASADGRRRDAVAWVTARRASEGRTGPYDVIAQGSTPADDPGRGWPTVEPWAAGRRDVVDRGRLGDRHASTPSPADRGRTAAAAGSTWRPPPRRVPRRHAASAAARSSGPSYSARPTMAPAQPSRAQAPRCPPRTDAGRGDDRPATQRRRAARRGRGPGRRSSAVAVDGGDLERGRRRRSARAASAVTASTPGGAGRPAMPDGDGRRGRRGRRRSDPARARATSDAAKAGSREGGRPDHGPGRPGSQDGGHGVARPEPAGDLDGHAVPDRVDDRAR